MHDTKGKIQGRELCSLGLEGKLCSKQKIPLKLTCYKKKEREFWELIPSALRSHWRGVSSRITQKGLLYSHMKKWIGRRPSWRQEDLPGYQKAIIAVLKNSNDELG